VVQWWGLIYW